MLLSVVDCLTPQGFMTLTMMDPVTPTEVHSWQSVSAVLGLRAGSTQAGPAGCQHNTVTLNFVSPVTSDAGFQPYECVLDQHLIMRLVVAATDDGALWPRILMMITLPA